MNMTINTVTQTADQQPHTARHDDLNSYVPKPSCWPSGPWTLQWLPPVCWPVPSCCH